ncbi:hypothetical protein BKA04_000793 [Cryobacterium mesophilum]|uniref:hypothetical protein n=1 Tax=Terrimesophilobacter mesophilus TaxID=433647 RepID=UPI0017B9CAD1|nr:hypothetical protein [Terrimesophilobacter mesophilus]MBB5632570.1 hypothetical protein [Terrimesophilobacter mesophilus]
MTQEQHHPDASTTPPLSDAAITELVLDTDPYLSCDDCFDQADEMIEAFLAETSTLSEAFRVHLRGCQACCEEALSLAEIVAPEYGMNPDAVSAQLQQLVRG